MKDFESALAFMKNWDGAFDGRDKGRFAAFVPFANASDAGLQPQDGTTVDTWGEVTPWSEQTVLEQLRQDAEFGLEKAEGERGVSAGCMFSVVNMWCHLLENGLAEDSPEDYGKTLFRSVLDHYGWAQNV